MKRIKELLLFITALLAPLALVLVISAFTAYVLPGRPLFVGIENYLRMFSNDRIFGKALLNTVLAPTICSFLIVAVFAMIVFIVRKKIKVPRKVFYIGGVFAGAIAALLCTVCVNVAFLRAPELSYAVQSIVSHNGDYTADRVNVLSISNVTLSLYIGILTTFIFWIMELTVNVVRTARNPRKAHGDEAGK